MVGKLATPEVAARLVVPRRCAPVVPPERERVTVPVKVVTVFPWASCAVTDTVGVILVPAVEVVGCVVNVRTVATPDPTLNAALVAGVSVPDLTPKVYAPALLIESPPKFATPAVATAVTVPDKTAPLGPLAIVIVSVPVNPTAVLPNGSWAVTWMAPSDPPAESFRGWPVKTS